MVLRNLISARILLSENISVTNVNIWLDLFNWIPLFFCFLGFQEYVRDEQQKELFIKFSLIGSIPVLLSCIGQLWLGWNSPISLFNGLIVWFQRPMTYFNALSGLFSSPNYLGFWLASIWPFTLFYLLKNKNKNKNKFFIALLSILISYFILLTNSRNALLGIFISIPVFFGFKMLFYVFLICLLIILILNQFSPIFISNLSFAELLPVKLINKFLQTNTFDFEKVIRLDIYVKAIELVKQKPILGWGASTFSILYLSIGGRFEPQHTHNIALEIAYNYGLPISILFTSFISIIIFKSFKIIFFKKTFSSSINKSWFCSFIIAMVYNFSDITYYDGKISLFIWILLAGLVGIIEKASVSYKKPIQS